MASILPGSIIHYPFLKINPKHFNFDIAEAWPELHRVPVFCQSDTWMYRIYLTSILINICYIKSWTYYCRTNSRNFIFLLQCSKCQNSLQIQWT